MDRFQDRATIVGNVHLPAEIQFAVNRFVPDEIPNAFHRLITGGFKVRQFVAFLIGSISVRVVQVQMKIRHCVGLQVPRDDRNKSD